MRKLTIIFILLMCFLFGLTLPYLFESYGPFIKNHVMGNGNQDIEDVSSEPEENKVNDIVVKKEKIDFEQLLTKAKNQFYDSKYKESINTYIELYKSGYDRISAAKNIIAVSNYLSEESSQASSLLSNMYDDYQDSIEYNYYYAEYLYKNGDKISAEELFFHLLILLEQQDSDLSDRKKALTYYYLGDIYLNSDRENVALDFFLKGIEHEKEIVLNYTAAAKVYKSKEKYEQAISMYKTCLNQDHSMSSLYYELAVLYEKTEEILKAYNYWQRCINSGIKTDIAQQHINDIRENYPQYFEREETEEKIVFKVDWYDIIEIEPNTIFRKLKIGLQENINKLNFQSQNDFIIKYDNNIIFEGNKDTRYQINFSDNTFYIFQNGEIKKSISPDQTLKISSTNKNNLFALYNIKFGQNYFWGGVENRQYRGDIHLQPITTETVNLINYIDLSSYLLSVVPSEIYASWPQESLKAQSVVARSYIINNLNRHKNEGYDLCADVHCIVYSGVKNEHPNTNAAILATKNEVITHQGNVIDAVFSNNSGGYTEASQYVWGNSYDYLKAVNISESMDYQLPLSPHLIEEWFVEKPPSYSDNKYTINSTYRWIKSVNLEALKSRHGLQDIRGVYITDRTDIGTVKEIKIEGQNKKVVSRDSSIRRDLTGLKSNKFIIKNIYDGNKLEKIIIFGAGWGHSVGMDQTAAAGMAVKDKSYRDIINYFYLDTEITKLE